MADNIKIDLLINAAQSAKTIGETKKALRDLKSEALNLKEGSAAFTRIATAAGELQDKIGDLSATTKYLGDDLRNIKGISGIGEGIAGGFAMASGAAALFGGENKKLEESMVKLQAVMAVIQGMQAIGNVLQKESAAVLFIKNTVTKAAIMLGWQDVAATEAQTVATVAGTVATEGQVVATESATIAQRLLNLAMRANPIGLLVTLILAGVSALMLWSNASSKAAEEEKKANEEKKKAADLQKKQNEERKKDAENIAKESTSYVSLIEKLRQTNAGSKERRDLIKQINSTYGSTLKNISDEKAFQDQLNSSVDNYIKFKEQEYTLKKNDEKITQALKQRTIAETELAQAQLGARLSLERGEAVPKSTQANIDAATKKIEKMDSWMTALGVSSTKASKSMEDLGFKTEEAMNKGSKATKDMTDEVKKSQLDILSITDNLNKEQEKRLSELKDWEISNMEDGIEKQKAILEKKAQDDIKSGRAATDEKIKEAKKVLDDQLKEDVKNKLITEKVAAEARVKALGETGKVGVAIEALKKIQADTEIQIEIDKNNKIADAEIEAKKKTTEDSQKLSLDSIEAVYEKEVSIMNSAREYAGESQIYTAEEYLRRLKDIEKAKEDMLKRISMFEGAESVTLTKMDGERYINQMGTLSEFTRKQKKEREKSIKDEQAQNKAAFKSGLIDEKEYNAERAAINKKWADDEYTYKREVSKDVTKMKSGDTEIEYDDQKTYLENLVALFDKKYGRITEIVTDANKETAQNTIDEDKKKLEDKEKFWEEMVALEQQGQELMMSVFSNAMAQREATVNKEYDAKIAKIDEEMLAYENVQANRTIAQQQEYDTQQGFENQKIEAQKVRDMELDKIKQKQFNAQKYNDMASIAINTALAVSKAVMAAPLTFGMPWSALLLAMGIAQEATVASKQYIPAFATGGIFNTNGMVNGPGSGTSDSVNAKLSNGEAVINAKSTKMFAPMLSAINQAGGGKAIPHLKNGGIYTEPSMQMQGGYLDTQAIVDAIYSTNERPIETYVSESSITTAQKNKQRLKGRTSF